MHPTATDCVSRTEDSIPHKPYQSAFVTFRSHADAKHAVEVVSSSLSRDRAGDREKGKGWEIEVCERPSFLIDLALGKFDKDVDVDVEDGGREQGEGPVKGESELGMGMGSSRERSPSLERSEDYGREVADAEDRSSFPVDVESASASARNTPQHNGKTLTATTTSATTNTDETHSPSSSSPSPSISSSASYSYSATPQFKPIRTLTIPDAQAQVEKASAPYMRFSPTASRHLEVFGVSEVERESCGGKKFGVWVSRWGCVTRVWDGTSRAILSLSHSFQLICLFILPL